METRAATRIPLSWEECNGYQWWFATPLDWAASNGFVESAIELLKLNASLIKDLASLARIRRLEDLWDDECRFTDAAKGRGLIVRALILHEWNVGSNSVIDSGYGPWALYTAAAAGDMEIVQRLLKIKPHLVFGNGEFGLRDMLYAAARANSLEIFRGILGFASCDYDHEQPLRSNNNNNNDIEYCRGMGIDVPFEVMNKALHAAATGGSTEILRELIRQSTHRRLNVVIWCKDSQGGTALHSAASRGHVEAVKEVLSAAPSTITFQDDNGNAALHVAAYNGHWGVVKEILRRVPPLFLTINNDGNTVLHLAVGGFKASGFRSPDRHMEVIKNLVSDKTLNLQTMVNCKNRDGKTPLHIAVILGKRSDEKLLNLLVSVPGLDINICDKNGMTAYDMVKATVASGLTPESLLKCLAEAGGRPMIPQSPTASQLLKRAAEQTEIIRLWAHKEDDEICTEQCEIIEEFSDKISEFANSNNMPGNQMNNYLAKHRRGTLSELFYGLRTKAHTSRSEHATSKENSVKTYVEEVAGFSQRSAYTKYSSPLMEQYFSANSVTGDDYSVFSPSPSNSTTFPTPSPTPSPSVLRISKVKVKGWLHVKGNCRTGAQAVDDSKPVMSLRNQYLCYGSLANFERQKATSRPPLPSRRAG
eukprot:PITA_18434